MAYSELYSRIRRFHSTAGAITKLLNWWLSLAEVEKASVDNLALLVSGGEMIISSERLSWGSLKHAGENGDNRAPVDDKDTEGHGHG